LKFVGLDLIVVSSVNGKGKFVPVLLVTEQHAMKAYWESGGIAHSFFDLGTRWK
jgi:hypothetical protein